MSSTSLTTALGFDGFSGSGGSCFNDEELFLRLVSFAVGICVSLPLAAAPLETASDASKKLGKTVSAAAACGSTFSAKPAAVKEVIFAELSALLVTPGERGAASSPTVTAASIVAAVEAFSADASKSLRRSIAAARAQLLLLHLGSANGVGNAEVREGKAVELVLGNGLDRFDVTVDNCEEARQLLEQDIPSGAPKAQIDKWKDLCAARFPRSLAFGNPVRPVAGDDSHLPVDL